MFVCDGIKTPGRKNGIQDLTGSYGKRSFCTSEQNSRAVLGSEEADNRNISASIQFCGQNNGRQKNALQAFFLLLRLSKTGFYSAAADLMNNLLTIPRIRFSFIGMHSAEAGQAMTKYPKQRYHFFHMAAIY